MKQQTVKLTDGSEVEAHTSNGFLVRVVALESTAQTDILDVLDREDVAYIRAQVSTEQEIAPQTAVSAPKNSTVEPSGESL